MEDDHIIIWNYELLNRFVFLFHSFVNRNMLMGILFFFSNIYLLICIFFIHSYDLLWNFHFEIISRKLSFLRINSNFSWNSFFIMKILLPNDANHTWMEKKKRQKNALITITYAKRRNEKEFHRKHFNWINYDVLAFLS